MSNYNDKDKEDFISSENYIEENIDSKMPKNIDITISLTLNKTFTIPTKDLEVDYFDASESQFIFTENSLQEIVKDLIVLPHEMWEYAKDKTLTDKRIKEEAKDWNVDDLTIIRENSDR
jgi:hypothetical protein